MHFCHNVLCEMLGMGIVMRRIIMTGGGTSGHVTPNIAMFEELKDNGFDIHYVGSASGIEKGLIEGTGVPFHSISSGKLRRYLDLKNVTDAFRVVKGFGDAIGIVRRLKPHVVFSKGGYVSTPLAWAAFMCRVPVVIHESDYTPGLANKLSLPFATKICYTFPETDKYLPQNKGVLTGIPVRSSLLAGKKDAGIKLCGFDASKPVLMIIGGSLGSRKINGLIRSLLDSLLKEFQICHICGKDAVEKELLNKKGYKQFEYISEDLPHIFAMADLVVSRAGATAIYEILALRKPNVLIPLSKKVSRGDQILNAASFEKQGYSIVLSDDELTEEILFRGIKEAFNNKSKQIAAMEKKSAANSIKEVMKVIKEAARP